MEDAAWVAADRRASRLEGGSMILSPVSVVEVDDGSALSKDAVQSSVVDMSVQCINGEM